jgi:josephin
MEPSGIESYNKDAIEEVNIYHEKQSRQLCALHVLNNLFQDPHAFTKADLDAICTRLSPNTWVNPHKSMIGLGNYDVNILMTGLQDWGYKTIWFDKRKSVETIQFENVYGFILNVPSNYKVFGVMPIPYNNKHWLAIKHFNNKGYYNLDSNLSKPLHIGEKQELIELLRTELSSSEKELLLVVREETKTDQLWVELQPEHK